MIAAALTLYFAAATFLLLHVVLGDIQTERCKLTRLAAETSRAHAVAVFLLRVAMILLVGPIVFACGFGASLRARIVRHRARWRGWR